MIEIERLVWDNFTGYFGGKRFFAVFLLCLLFLCICQKKTALAKTTVSYTILLLAVIFFPLTARIIMYDIIGEDVYWRMFWLLPAAFVVAGTAAWFIDKNKLSVIVLIALLVFSGNNLYMQDQISAAENLSKLDGEVIALTEALRADAAEHFPDRDVKACFPQELYCYVRQYDATIRMPYGRNAERQTELTKLQNRLYHEMEAEEINYVRLTRLLLREGCDYVVLSEEASAEAMSARGFVCVAETARFSLFRYLP